jgi:hypothetical protein
MNIGDLVRPVSMTTDHWRGQERVGIVTEISADGDGDGIKQIFVRWFGHTDWSFEYSDGVEIISKCVNKDK